MSTDTLWHQDPAPLLAGAPALAEFVHRHQLTGPGSLAQRLAALSEDQLADIGCDRASLGQQLDALLAQAQQASPATGFVIDSLTLIGGQDKQGRAEDLQLTLVPGSITCIVGPTGSGKSRLLADIEWMAQGDTPTRRRILINGAVPPAELRFSLEHKLVAQLSQNMNFVMDASAGDFIAMHAESRGLDPTQVTSQIIDQANRLAGEPFAISTPVTALSGGQSRALMIADTAFLSASPVVLIDEVENAGIDRKQALQLLVRQEKIVLMATHDPLLALMGQQRLIIRHGGIQQIRQTSEAERANLQTLEQMDACLQGLRHRLRQGEALDRL
ncbi:ATP-binding cassette domain-containing protein [Pseudaeromonas sp. ZJS20]|uniref:ATP-binding cassette domain-containing protein n=1 Tax=Pseudaeromonas aegiceratis TaxID=3153928 RepID=UPI00390C8EE5